MVAAHALGIVCSIAYDKVALRQQAHNTTVLRRQRCLQKYCTKQNQRLSLSSLSHDLLYLTLQFYYHAAKYYILCIRKDRT